jgi:DNA-binding transcriptional LysR family regulator
MATMQFAMRDMMADFLLRYPKVNVVAHATDQNVDIVGENYDVAIRAHSDPLPDSTLRRFVITDAGEEFYRHALAMPHPQLGLKLLDAMA